MEDKELTESEKLLKEAEERNRLRKKKEKEQRKKDNSTVLSDCNIKRKDK